MHFLSLGKIEYSDASSSSVRGLLVSTSISCRNIQFSMIDKFERLNHVARTRTGQFRLQVRPAKFSDIDSLNCTRNPHIKKTPFTLYLNQANIPLQRIDSRSFVPAYPLPFVAGDTTTHHVGERCCVNYRWHDAFDVFVAVLEARLVAGLSIPVESHLPDLYLMYQLQGESRFVPDAAQYPKAPAVALADGQAAGGTPRGTPPRRR